MDIKKFLTKDTLVLVVLFAAMLLWKPFYEKFLMPPPSAVKPVVTSSSTNVPPAVAATNAPAAVVTPPVATPPVAEIRQPAREPRQPETFVELTNGFVRLRVSSYGGCIKSVELPRFAASLTNKAPVVLDFGTVPALAYNGLAGLGEDADFKVSLVSNGAAARIEAMDESGIRLVRTIRLGDRYEVTVEEVLSNNSDQPVTLPSHTLSIGSMGMLEGETLMSGVDFLGIDSLSFAGGEGIRYWNYKRWFSDDLVLADYFEGEARRGKGCMSRRPPLDKMLPAKVTQRIPAGMEWVAVKNKFFVQILNPKGPKSGVTGFDLVAERTVGRYENASDPGSWAQAAVPSRVAAAIQFEGRHMVSGDSFSRTFSYYVGPKELDSLRPLGLQKKEVMDFGTLRLVCEGLVWSLGMLYGLIPNYGIAIILLTLIVRIIFWPLTHKGTESMKRMQELQPQIKALQEKYKDKPQKLQQETMELYKVNKVNPLGGCLPMLIQIPVFFALFQVLRSGVELRFAPFLWVGDLSAPENLLHGMIPVVGSLNLLPLLMTVTQIWQTKLTPAAGDPMQQKMMMWMMPIMMLVFLYSMPSALVLYWTANQVMMIIQLYWQRRMKKA